MLREEIHNDKLVIEGNVGINGTFCGRKISDEGCVTITLSKYNIKTQTKLPNLGDVFSFISFFYVSHKQTQIARSRIR